MKPQPVQHAQFTVRLGERSLKAEITVTSSGLLAVGALVSAILLSTAVVVRAARSPATATALPGE